MIRILQVAASVAPSDGGPTTGVLGLNAAYNRRPHTTAIALVTDADGRSGRLSDAAREAVGHDQGVDVRVFPRSRPFRIKHSRQQRLAINQAASSADLIHIHGVYLAHTVWAYLAARRFGCRYVVQPHGALEPYQGNTGRARKHVWDSFIGRRLLHNANGVIAASQAEARNLRRRHPDARVMVMPLGVAEVDYAAPLPLRAALRKWLDAPRHRRVLFLGRLARKKRPDLLIDAWNRLDHGQLAIAGPDGEWSRATLQARISRNRSDSVVFLGQTAPPISRWMMKEAGVFVLPSENENFALVVAEAMDSGCAVVTTPQTAASEHVSRARAGIVRDFGDAGTLASALQEAMSNETTSEKMGRLGAAYAKKFLTWDNSVQLLLEDIAGQLSEPRLNLANTQQGGIVNAQQGGIVWLRRDAGISERR